MKRIFIILLLFLLFYDVTAQNTIGLSDIINYTNQAYGAGAQNWDIKQDEKGILYFGNNEGLLTFDGSYWKLYKLPNKTVVRSLEIGVDHKIYVGGQNEIGFFSPNENGVLKYTSLMPLLPENERSFSDVWNIISYGKGIFFRSSTRIIKLEGKNVTIYPNEDWRFLGISNRQLIAQGHNNQLFVYTNDTWVQSLDKSNLPQDFLITSFVPYSPDTSLVTTLKNGIYFLINNRFIRFTTPAFNYITQKNIYTSLDIGNNRILLATSLDGAFVIDKNGNLIQSFSIPEGLQNNNIRHVFLDKNNNLWLGLDNGIDFIAFNNAIKQINPDKQNKGAGYAAIIKDNTFYIGTSNGLYQLPLDNSKNLSLVKGVFKPVAGSEGQVWNLTEVYGKLLMGHHEGYFIVNNNKASLLDNSVGFWNFSPLSQQSSPLMLAGNYQGVNFYRFDNDKFINSGIKAHFESSRFVVTDNEDIWVAHPYKGIFRINYSPPASKTIRNYSKSKGLSSINHYFIFKIKNRIVAPTENGFFEFNTSADSFQRSTFFEKIFGPIRTNYLKEDKQGNIWFTSEKNLGVVDFSGRDPKIIYITELTGKFLRGFEFIYPVDINNVLVSGENGFYHINYEQYRTNNNRIEVLIRTVKAIQTDSLIFGGYDGMNKIKSPELNYNLNSLHFDYSSVLYGQQSNIEYSYFLKGFDKNWSEWLKRTDKEYTNLPSGTYTFQVKARNNLGNESEIGAYSFTILPPWYETKIAWVIYILLFVIGNYILFIFLKRKFKQQQIKHNEEQKRLQYLHQLEKEKADREIVKLKNEKLEAELQHKNNELASVAMHLVQKGELLAKIKDQMVRLKKHTGAEKDSDDLKKIINIIKDENNIDKQWEQFTIHFDNVHSDFHAALKRKYPSLSSNELKLSAYLRMNLSTKEIAQLMNISVRGVEISRYRLRKKLQVGSEISLHDFLIAATST
jgi:ligand-binding sensor domain-containing protein/DNA-binding CsgD family transcriptional regulator